VAFCGPCAREQEEYFAIGLTWNQRTILAFIVCKVLTTFASGNLRGICSPSESVFDTESVVGMPREKSSEFDMSTRIFPLELSPPASSCASNEATPDVALTTISLCAALRRMRRV
jgi:hypothetical protein